MEPLSLSLPMSEPAGDLDLLTSQARAGDPQSIEKVAHSFESLFVSLLVKQMRQTLEPETLFGQDKGDVLGGLFDHFMGEHLAKCGMLGIADLVRQQLTPTTRTP